MKSHSTGRSRSIRHEAVRAEILGAASSAIAEHGHYGMTMRGLARSTGRALANFYNYFSSKEDLLFALQAKAFKAPNSSAEKALAGVYNPVARLYVLVFNHVCYVAEHRATIRILVHEASALPAGRRRTVRVLKERYFQTARGIVSSILSDASSARNRGAPEESEVERARYSVFDMLNWSYGWYDSERHGPPHEVARTIYSVVLRGLARHCPYPKNMERHLGMDNMVLVT